MKIFMRPKIFTCPDGTAFVIDKISAVGPIFSPILPRVPYRFIVDFTGGGTSSFPAHDRPTIQGDGMGYTAYLYDRDAVRLVREQLLRQLEGT